MYKYSLEIYKYPTVSDKNELLEKKKYDNIRQISRDTGISQQRLYNLLNGSRTLSNLKIIRNVYTEEK